MLDGARRGISLLRENERLAVILISTLLVMSGQGVMSPVLPLFAVSLGGGATAIGLTLSTFALARLLLNVPLGILSDRHGRRLLLVGGPLVSAAGMWGSGMATDLAELFAWRFVAGAGSAMYMTGAQIYLIDISSPSTRARVIGANRGALLLGTSIGPALGGLLAESAGLRFPFLVVAGASLFTTAYAYARLPETHGEVMRSALEPGSEEIDSRGADSPRRRWLTMMASRQFAAVASVTASIFFTRAGSRMTLMPLLAASRFDYSAGRLGVLFSAMALINLLGLAPASWVADRFGRRWAIVPSGVLIALALLAMAGAQSDRDFVASAMLLALGTALIGPAPAAYVADIAPAELRGLAMGLYRSAGDAGLLVGPLLLGALADATAIAWGLVANAAVVLAAAIFFGIAAHEPGGRGVSGQRSPEGMRNTIE